MIKNAITLTAAAVLGLSLAACGERDEPIEEEVQADIDEAGDDMEDGAEDMAADMEDGAEAFGDDVEEAADDVEDEVDPD